MDRVGQTAHRLFDPVHQIAIVGVGQIDLECVTRPRPIARGRLIRVATDFVDAVESLHDGRRGRTARVGLQRSDLHLEEFEGIQEVP